MRLLVFSSLCACLVSAPALCSAKKRSKNRAAGASMQPTRAKLSRAGGGKLARSWRKALKQELEQLHSSGALERMDPPTPPSKVHLTPRSPYKHSVSLWAKGAQWDTRAGEIQLSGRGAVMLLYPLGGSQGKDLRVQCQGRFPEGPFTVALSAFSGGASTGEHLVEVPSLDSGKRLKVLVDPAQRRGKWLLVTIFTPRLVESVNQYCSRRIPPKPWKLTKCTIERLQ